MTDPTASSDTQSPSETMSRSRSLLPFLETTLREFTSSSSSFRILYTHPPTRLPPPSVLPLKTLYVLDSSFNPPSRAHAWLAKSAVLSGVNAEGTDRGEDVSPWEGKRLLLLLATQNADKQTKPAAFEDRLVMMVSMARQIYSQLLDTEKRRLGASRDDEGDGKASLGFFQIDVGVTKYPFFVHKASSIEDSGVYGEKGRFEQVHLTGFDTLTRIFDKKYYEKGMGVVGEMLDRGRVRAVLRPSGGWGEMAEQREWVEGIRRGELEDDGVRKEWADRIELVEDDEGVASGVSSTKVREAVKEADRKTVEDLVGAENMEWIRERKLYLGEGGGRN